MARVGRGAIGADRGARGILAVERVMAVGAQAAERAESEGVVVAAVRLDVVGDGRWCDAAGF
jgi:Flp pilus assembly protein CpaB